MEKWGPEGESFYPWVLPFECFERTGHCHQLRKSSIALLALRSSRQAKVVRGVAVHCVTSSMA